MTSTSTNWRYFFTYWAEILVAVFSTFVFGAAFWARVVPGSLGSQGFDLWAVGVGFALSVVSFLIVNRYVMERKRVRRLRMLEELSKQLTETSLESLAGRTIDVDVLKAELKALEAKSEEMKAIIQAIESNRSKDL